MDIDVVAKLAQTAFYCGGLILGYLTYRRVKTTILNTINTEYHKKVIERLATISEDLYEDFGFTLGTSKANDVKYVTDIINQEALAFKKANPTEWNSQNNRSRKRSNFFAGVPVTPTQVKTFNMLKRYKSDPFLPETVRAKLLDLLEKRSSVTLTAFNTVMTKYQKDLTAGKFRDTLDSNWHFLNNQVGALLREGGVGTEQVEEAVHDIRLEVKRYFDKFTPK